MNRQERERLRAGELWQEHGLVFASRIGTPLTADNAICAFRIITSKAGLGEDRVPREMRHTFVSALSADGVPVESIALLAGHERPATTESDYRHEIRPALTQGAEVMDKILGQESGCGPEADGPLFRSSITLRALTWKRLRQPSSRA
jgi:site-specific recombinase XerD